MSKLFPQLTSEEEVIYKWKYRYGGDFADALMEAIARADLGNQELLALGFPDEVRGFQKFANQEGWWQEVKLKVREGATPK